MNIVLKIVIQEQFPKIEDLNLCIGRSYLIHGKDWSSVRHILIKLLHSKNKEEYLQASKQKV